MLSELLAKINFKVLGLAVAAVAVIFLGLFLLLREKPGPAVDFALKGLPGNSDTSAANISGDLMAYSNGRFIAGYDVKTGAGRQLTLTRKLPEVLSLSLSPNQDFVIFETDSEVSDYPELVANLPTHYEGDGQNLWWYADTATGQVKLLAISSDGVAWLDDQTAVYGAGNNIIKRDLTDGSTSTVYKGDRAVTGLGAVEGGFMFQVADSEVLYYDLDEGKSSTVYDGYRTVVFGTKQGCLLASTGDEDTLEPGSTLVGCVADKPGEDLDLGKNLAYGIFSQDGKYLFYAESGEKEPVNRYVDLQTGQKGPWQADGGPGQNGVITYAASGKRVLVTGNSRFYGSDVVSPKLIEGNPTFRAPGLTMDLSSDTQEVNVSKQEGDFNNNDENAINAVLVENGFDPVLMNINYIVATSDDYRW